MWQRPDGPQQRRADGAAASVGDVMLTRGELVAGAAASGLAATGIYELVDLLGRAPTRASAAASFAHTQEQHILQNLRIVISDGVEVFVPPLHHLVVTATLQVDETPAALAEARAELEHRLQLLDDRFPQTPAGLGLTVAWGLPYFERYVPGQARKHLPVDRRATAARGHQLRVLEDAIRFPSDPRDTILEANDVAFLIRSDLRDHIDEAARELFGRPASAFRVTSIRRGFVGGGFEGGRSLPKRMALAAGVPGADLIPDSAELFLGFTSTQRQAQGRERIANLETLDYADLGPSGYFRHGTHMHLSHLFEDLEAWYKNFTFQQRADATFHPGLRLGPGTQTVRQGPQEAQNADAVARDYRRYRHVGHSGSIQSASRLDRDLIGPDGVDYREGTPIPHRADFNTLDNPFFWSARPARDRFRRAPKAGLHFVVFNPTSDDFRRNRLAMDGVLPDGRTLRFAHSSEGQGFNAVLTTTHRQNFLVPPRKHRSYPLSEFAH